MRDKKFQEPILILGNGTYCIEVANEIALLGSPVTVALFGPADLLDAGFRRGEVAILPVNQILDFSGQVGNFRAVFEAQEGGRNEGSFGSVVVAMQCSWVSPLAKWGLSETSNITTISNLQDNFKAFTDLLEPKDKVVFVCGFKHNSLPLSQEQMVIQAIKVRQSSGAKVYVLTEHFKVAKEGLERLVGRAREAGVMFVKFSSGCPDIDANGEKMLIKYYDETLGGNIQICPRLIVFEEEACPPDEASHLSEFLGINLDQRGFLQGDYVYNLPVFTNRTGIFVAGSGKGPLSTEQGAIEAKAVAVEVTKLLEAFKEPEVGIIAELDERRCGQCLTCFRICPHRAISLYQGKAKPEISSLACRGCGVCVAACPMKAIDLQGAYDRGGVLSEAKEAAARLARDCRQNGSKILIFACENSACDAYELAKEREFALPASCGVVKVPCGGRVDLQLVLEALHTGVDGVMVLACHHDSCKSVYGSKTCEKRVELLQDMLGQAGEDKARLGFGTTAPGAAPDLADQIMAFAKRFE